jgi:hypothetical protein
LIDLGRAATKERKADYTVDKVIHLTKSKRSNESNRLKRVNKEQLEVESPYPTLRSSQKLPEHGDGADALSPAAIDNSIPKKELNIKEDIQKDTKKVSFDDETANIVENAKIESPLDAMKLEDDIEKASVKLHGGIVPKPVVDMVSRPLLKLQSKLLDAFDNFGRIKTEKRLVKIA